MRSAEIYAWHRNTIFDWLSAILFILSRLHLVCVFMCFLSCSSAMFFSLRCCCCRHRSSSLLISLSLFLPLSLCVVCFSVSLCVVANWVATRLKKAKNCRVYDTYFSFLLGRYLKLTLSLALHSSFAYFFTRDYLKLALSLALYSTFSLLYFHFFRDLWKCFLMRLIDCLCAKQLAQLCRRVRTKTNMSAKQSLSALMLQVQINKFLMMRRELYRYPGFA